MLRQQIRLEECIDVICRHASTSESSRSHRHDKPIPNRHIYRPHSPRQHIISLCTRLHVPLDVRMYLHVCVCAINCAPVDLCISVSLGIFVGVCVSARMQAGACASTHAGACARVFVCGAGGRGWVGGWVRACACVYAGICVREGRGGGMEKGRGGRGTYNPRARTSVRSALRKYDAALAFVIK
jgi:hypothetical protein